VGWGIRKYARRPTFTPDVYVSVWLAFFCSFGILILIPLDLALAITGRREGEQDGYEENIDDLESIYEILFGFCFFLYTVVIVMQQYFIDSGYFTVKDRLKDGLWQWTKLSLATGILGLIILIIVVAGNHVESGDAVAALTAMVVSVSNTFGLVAIVMLLGYSIVEFPRSLWVASDYHELLHRYEMAFASENRRKQEANLETTQTVADIHATAEKVRRTCNPVLMEYAELCIADCPEGYGACKTGEAFTNTHGAVTETELATLRQKVKWNRSYLRGTQRRWEQLSMEAYRITDILEAENPNTKTIKWSPLFYDGMESTQWQRNWLVVYRPWVMKFFAFCAGVMSLFVILGQIGMMAGYDSGVSIWSDVLHDEDRSGGGIVWFAMFSLGYCTYLVFWSLFRVRLTIGGVALMELIPDQQTSSYSMLMCSYLCARLAPPLAFYYTSLVFESGIFDGTWLEDPSGVERPAAFAKFYGQALDVVPFIGNHFAVFFPVVILCLSVLQFANVLNRFFVLIRMPQLQFGDPIVEDSLIIEGKKQLTRMRQQKERTAARNAGRRAVKPMAQQGWLSRLGAMLTGSRRSMASNDDIEKPQLLETRESESSIAPLSPRREKSAANPTTDDGETKGLEDDEDDVDDMLAGVHIDGIDDNTGAAVRTSNMPPTIEGYLKMRSPNTLRGRQWKDRWFAVDVATTELKYWRESNLEEERGSIQLRGSTIQLRDKDSNEDPRRFQVVQGSRKCKLMAKSAEEAQYWIKVLTEWSNL